MAKGGEYEREFCKRLSLWWTVNEADDVFWRTSNSGGRATVRGRKGKPTSGHYGDVGATDERGKSFLRFFTVELKRGYTDSADWSMLIDKPKGAAWKTYHQWFKKAEQNRRESGAKSWLLVVRRDRRQDMAFLPADDFWSIVPPDVPLDQHVRLILMDGEEIYAMTLTSFLAFLEPKTIMKLCQT
jgi:hypothetical protein